MKLVYAVPYIEVEFGWGSRREGYKLYTALEDCIKHSIEVDKKASQGKHDYYGPVHPLQYTEVPLDSLDKDLKDKLKKNSRVHTEDRWSPKFSGKIEYIKYA